jgi:streptogramin lyase
MHIMRANMTRLSARRAIVWTLLSLLLLAVVSGTGASGDAAGTDSFTAEYPVPGSPYQVAVEAPSRVWATLPAQNAIVRLTLTSPAVYDVALFGLPPGSEPYDIAFAAGRVWFTDRLGNRIGSLDPASNPAAPAWTWYPIENTPNSEPTGITVIVGEPIEVWFAERAGNKLGRLTVSGMGPVTFNEYPLPQTYANAYPESVSATTTESIWFTAPGISRIGRFRLSYWGWNPDAFAFVPTGSGSQPWDIKVAIDGAPWLTEPHGNRILKYNPQTLTYFNEYRLPISASTPYGLDIAGGVVWFTERDGNRAGQLRPMDPSASIMREFPLPEAAPTGIAVDATGCAWIAGSNQDKIISWCPPYFHFVYLPLAMKNKGVVD